MTQENPDIMNIDSLLRHLILIENITTEEGKYGLSYIFTGKFLLYDKYIKVYTTSKLVIKALESIKDKLPIIGSFYKRTSKQGYDYYILDTPVVLNKQANDITFEEIQKKINMA